VALIFRARHVFFDGFLTTLELLILSGFLAFLLAFLFGLMRVSWFGPLRAIAIIYIEFFRGVSLLVQLFWLFFVLPFFGIYLEPMTTAVLGLGLCNGAYGAEIVRGAIEAVPRGQIEAAIAVNYTRQQRMWNVVLPQAIPAMLPPLANQTIDLLKATSLVSLITIKDLSFQALTLRETTMRTLEPFSVVLIGYFVLAMAVSGLFRLLERYFNIGLDRGGVR
jgi:polar amino acid transport system permease protein